jgi:hypothetical protein
MTEEIKNLVKKELDVFGLLSDSKGKKKKDYLVKLKKLNDKMPSLLKNLSLNKSVPVKSEKLTKKIKSEVKVENGKMAERKANSLVRISNKIFSTRF